MKKLISLSIVALFAMSSCYTINYGGKKPLFLVDAPPNTTVTNKLTGEKIEIGEYSAFRSSRTTGNVQTTTHFMYPGFLLKFKKKNVIELNGGKEKSEMQIKGTAGVGMLIFEGIFTAGIGTIVDLATNSFRYPKARLIDVPAVLNGTKPRSQKELKKRIMSGYK